MNWSLLRIRGAPRSTEVMSNSPEIQGSIGFSGAVNCVLGWGGPGYLTKIRIEQHRNVTVTLSSAQMPVLYRSHATTE